MIIKNPLRSKNTANIAAPFMDWENTAIVNRIAKTAVEPATENFHADDCKDGEPISAECGAFLLIPLPPTRSILYKLKYTFGNSRRPVF